MKCLDTYALVEIHNNNPKFSQFLDEEPIIPDTTLAEFYGFLYRKHGKATADYWHRKLSILCKGVSREILVEAVIFKINNNKLNISYFDSVGYIFAKNNKIKFVTGDNQFKNFENVEFVK